MEDFDSVDMVVVEEVEDGLVVLILVIDGFDSLVRLMAMLYVG